MIGFEQLRQELRAATERQARATERPRSVPTSGGPTRRAWRWQLVALSTAVASALVVVIAALPNEAGRTLGPASVGLARAAERECARAGRAPARSSRCLSALGAVADAWQVPGHGDVLYVRRWWGTSALYVGQDGRPGARPDEPGAFMVQRGAEQEVWIRPDASGESLQHGESAPRLASPADRASWVAAGRPKIASSRPATGDDIAMQGPGSARQTWRAGGHAPDLFPVGETDDSEGGPVLVPDGDPLRVFTPNPVVLAKEVRRFAWRQRIELSGERRCSIELTDCSSGTRRRIHENETIVAVGLLRYPLSPQSLRAAVLRMLAGKPGYQVLGMARDPTGRSGVAVQLPTGSAGLHDTLLLDPSSARLIAIGSTSDGTMRTARWSDLLDLETARVERVGERPARVGERPAR